MSGLRFPKWRKLCKEALLEADPERLFLRVIVAETAIFHRLHDMKNIPDNIELEAMDGMLKNLQRLVANAFVLPSGGEWIPDGPLGSTSVPLRPNRPRRQTQPSA